MNETVKLLLSLSLSGSILAVLIFALKPLLKKRLSKSIQYYIWIIVLLRLVLPFAFDASIMNELFYGNEASVITNSQGEVQPTSGTEQNISSFNQVPNVKENVANGVYNGDVSHSKYFSDLFNQYALYLWMLGVLIVLAANLSGYVRFLIHLKQANKPATDEESKILAEVLKGRAKVRLVRNHLVTTPMLIGIINPYIVIPDINFNEIQLKNILLHEVVHFRRFDIGLKWLTMIASAIHWFNPLMHFVKKEINYACELSCDEAVIKNLSLAEKQSYGDTLISVVAEHKCPMGVLQATMCEEKKSLKERLIAIMNHNKKSKLIIVLSVILLGVVIFCALYLGAGVGARVGKATPPNIYVSTEYDTTKAAITGTYAWSYRGIRTKADSDHPINFKYTLDNIVSATGKQQLILDTQKLNSDKKYDFTIEKISVYKDEQLVEFESVEPSFMNSSLYIQAPPEAGEYIYSCELNFKDKGTVTYGFVVRVDMLTYNLEDIAKDKTPYVGDGSKASAIAGRLPVPDSYFEQHYIALETNEKPYGLTIYYEAKEDVEYGGEWPIVAADTAIEANSRKNALVVFCMIDNVDEVTFAFRNSRSNGKLEESKYNTTFTFPRAYFEEKYGDLSMLGKNLDLLQAALEENLVAKTTSIQSPKNDQIEKYLEIITSPSLSSNPQDYIKAHPNEYDSILKMDTEALNYLLTQFEEGSNNNDLRGHIMMALCKDLLGDSNSVTDESLSPQDWFLQLKADEEIKLHDFQANVSDQIEQLVYDAAVNQYSRQNEGFTVVAPTIFDSYEEGNKLKVFVTVFSNRYKLYDKTLSEVGGSVIPAAITFTKNGEGSYTLDEYLEAGDGSYFGKSIKEYCIMPVSKKEIKGLYERIMEDYGSNKKRSELLMENLIEHLKTNSQKDIILNKELVN